MALQKVVKKAPAAVAKQPAKTTSPAPPIKANFGDIGNPSQKGAYIFNPKTVGKQGGGHDFSGVKPLVGFGGVSGGGYIENPNDPGHGWGYNPGLASGTAHPPGFSGPNTQGPNGAPGPFPTYQTPGTFGPAAPDGSNDEPVNAVASEAGLPHATEAQRQNFYQRTYGGLGLQAMAPWDIQRHNDKISAMYQKQGKQVPPDKLLDATYGGMVDPMVANMRNLTPAQKNSAEYKTAMRDFDNYGRRLGGLPVGPPLPNGVQPNDPTSMAAANRVQALRAQGAGRSDPYVAPPYSGPPANSKMGASTTASSAPGGGFAYPGGSSTFDESGGGSPGGFYPGMGGMAGALKSKTGAGGGYGNMRDALRGSSQGGMEVNSSAPPLTPGPAVPGGNGNIPSSMGGSINWGNGPQNGPRQMPYKPAPSYPGQGTGGAAIDQLRSKPGNSWDGNSAWTDPKTPPPDDSWPWKPGGSFGSVSPGGGNPANTAQQKQAAPQVQQGQQPGGMFNAAYNNTARQRMNAQVGPPPQQNFGGPIYQPSQQQQAPQAPQAPTMPQAPQGSGWDRQDGAGGGFAYPGGSSTFDESGGFGGGTPPWMQGPFVQPFGGKAGMQQMLQGGFNPEMMARLQGALGGGDYRGMMGGQFGGSGGFPPKGGQWSAPGRETGPVSDMYLNGPSSFINPAVAPQTDATMDWWRNRNGMPQRPGDSDWAGRGDFGGFVPGMGMRSGMKPQQPQVANDSGFYAPQPAPEQRIMAPDRHVGMEQSPIGPAVMPDPMQYTF